MSYKLSDEQFKEALRAAVSAHEAEAYPGGVLPPDFKPFYIVYHNPDHTINRDLTLQRGDYSYIPAEQKAALLEKV